MIIKCTKYDLLQLPAKQGQIYYVTDLRALFQDMGNHKSSRRNFPALVLNTERERVDKIRPSNGRNYYVVESNNLWMYDTKWVLRDGDITKYNTYVYDGNYGVTPSISVDPFITSSSGDRIIDNNGLLGDGSVVIRDSNRISRAVISADARKSEMAFTSYLDNGMRFYPYGLESASMSREELGTLHLGIESQESGTSVVGGIARKGRAQYNGDFYFNGEVYLTQVADPLSYNIGYTPEENMSMTHKFTGQLNKKASNGARYIEYHAFKINVISESQASVTITTYTTDYNIAAQRDDGGMIYDGVFVWGNEITYESKRSIEVLDDYVSVTYKLIGEPNNTEVTLFNSINRATGFEVNFNNNVHNDVDETVTGTTELKEEAPLSSLLNKLGIQLFKHKPATTT